MALLQCCHGAKQFHLVASGSQLVQNGGSARLDFDTFDDAVCELGCKEKYTYVAMNHHGLKIRLELEKHYKLSSHDSVVPQQLVLRPGDSIVLACGCQDQHKLSPGDWVMELKIMSVVAADSSATN
jgi:hypothetical protein